MPESCEPTRLHPSWSWTPITGGVLWSVEWPEEGFVLNSVAHVQHTDNVTPSQPDISNSSDPRIVLQVSCMQGRITTISAFRGIVRYRAELAEFPFSGEVLFEPDAFVMTRPPELLLAIGAGCFNDESLVIYGLAVSSSTSCVGALERVGFITFYVKKEKDGGNSTVDDYAILHELSRREDFILV